MVALGPLALLAVVLGPFIWVLQSTLVQVVMLPFQEARAAALAATLAERVYRRTELVAAVAADLAAYTPDTIRLIRRAREWAPFVTDFAGFGVVDPEGATVVLYDPHPGDIPPIWSIGGAQLPASATKALAAGSPVVTDIGPWMSPNGAGVAVLARLTYARGGQGLVVGGFLPGRSGWLRDFGLSPQTGGDQLLVLDANAKVLYGRDPAAIGGSSPLDVSSLIAGRTVRAMRVAGPTPDADVMVSYAPVDGTSWGVVLAEPWATAVQPLETLVVGMRAFGVLGGAAVAILVLWEFSRGALSLDLLLRRLRTMHAGHGERLAPLPSFAHPEIHEVVQATNLLLAGLEERSDRLRHRAADLVSEQDSERERLATHLYDTAVQDLTAIRLRLESAARLPAERRAQALQDISNARQIAAGLEADLRDVTRDLHLPALQEYGLVGALDHALQVLGRRLPHVRLVFNTPTDLPELTETEEVTLYRTAQEALLYCAQWAPGATRITVTLSATQGRVRLAVLDDDGSAAAGDTSEDERTIAYMAIARTAELVGASVAHSVQPGTGSRLVISLPVAPGAARGN